MPRRIDPEKPGYAKRVIVDRAAYNQYMRDYRARKARERVEVVERERKAGDVPRGAR